MDRNDFEMPQEQNEQVRHHHYRKDDGFRKAGYLKVRNVLNIIFMLGAVAGVIVWATANQTVGIIIILASMAFKLVECALRFIH
jgi:hypothetical protein